MSPLPAHAHSKSHSQLVQLLPRSASPSPNYNVLDINPNVTTLAFCNETTVKTAVYEELTVRTKNAQIVQMVDTRKEEFKHKSKSGWKRFLGIICTLSASLNFSIGILFVKLLQPYQYHGNCTTFWRYIGITVPAIPMLFLYEFGHYFCPPMEGKNKTGSVFKTVWPLHEDQKWKTAIGVLARGFFAAVAVILRYYALEYLTIGDAAVITCSTPILVTILAHFALGEKAGFMSIACAVTTILGVGIVVQPPLFTGSETFSNETLIGTCLAVASLICASIQVIITRMVRAVHFSLLTVTVGLIGLTLGGCLMLYFDNFEYPTQLDNSLWYVAGLCVTSFFGQISIILALKFECAGPVSVIKTSDVLFVFALQFLFLNVIPEWTSVVGGCLVFSSVLLTAMRKWLAQLPEYDTRRQILKFILL